MLKSSKAIKLKKDDWDRVLLTEMLPAELPLPMSNEGFYSQILSFPQMEEGLQKELIKNLIFDVANRLRRTEPLKYQIRKDQNSVRCITLMHPAAQYGLRCFYKQHANLIIYYTSLSSISIRSPKKIAGSFYRKTSWQNINRFKDDGGLNNSRSETLSRFSPSFFAYRGYDRLYKFLNSEEYYLLEAKFPKLLTLDVSRCFESIYTHSITWATRDKRTIKDHLQQPSFGDDFDKKMQFANFAETNGIPIGPEVSRIFAEIIFQRIDVSASRKLSEHSSRFAIRRYVDDVFIFAESSTLAQKIYDVYSQALAEFNLHANAAKKVSLNRPFVVPRAVVANQAKIAFFAATRRFLDEDHLVSAGTLTPLKKFDGTRWEIIVDFRETVRNICGTYSDGFDLVTPLIIGMISERLKKLVARNTDKTTSGAEAQFRDSFLILIETAFYFYRVSPSVSSANRVATMIILCSRFVDEHLQIHADLVKGRILRFCIALVDDLNAGQIDAKGSPTQDDSSLGNLNIVLATKFLGPRFQLSEGQFQRIFKLDGLDKASYFTLLSATWYLGASTKYAGYMQVVVQQIILRLKMQFSCQKTESVMLFLDILACPYIDRDSKDDIVKDVLPKLGLPVQATKAAREKLLSDLVNKHFFFDWRTESSNILTLLEKRELKQAY
jgi:Reverse transcriptase (RNA-dependent DNA polymerase)